jgi:hypothetical protein
VAEAIVDALKFPRRDVFVPRQVGVIHKLTYPFPMRAQLAVARAFKSENILKDIDHGARAAYEDRAAHSEPGLEPESAAATEEAVIEPAEAAK